MIISTSYAARKSSDQSVASNTNLTNDTDLVLPIDPSSIVAVRLVILFALAGVLSGFKFGLAGPASPSNIALTAEVRNMAAPALVASGVLSALGTLASGALATTGTHLLIVQGMVENGPNSGNLTFQFAQNVSDLGSITIKRGSAFTISPCL